MGTWGTGLYSSDSSKDIETTIKSILRLPFDNENILNLILEEFKSIISDENDEDYYIFWLVLADQFHKYGIINEKIQRKAIEIIDQNKDLEKNKELGMDNSSLKARSKNLQKLKEFLTSKNQQKTRKLLKKPEELILNSGDIIKFPLLQNGFTINPYFSEKDLAEKIHLSEITSYSYAIILSSKLVFNYLASYWPVVYNKPFDLNKATNLENIISNENWLTGFAGVCNRLHFKKMKLEIIGSCEFTSEINEFRQYEDGYLRYAAMNDISIANSLQLNQERYLLKEKYNPFKMKEFIKKINIL